MTEELRTALGERRFWYLATVNRSGFPQVTPVWAMERDGRIAVNTAVGRVKDRNMRRDPRVALSAHNPENPYEKLIVRGEVAEVVEGKVAENDIDELSRRYTGNYPYPWRSEGERRVTFLIEPTRVSG